MHRVNDQYEKSVVDRLRISEDHDILQEQKLFLSQQVSDTRNQLEEQQKLHKVYQSTLKSYEVKLNQEKALISELRKNEEYLQSENNLSQQEQDKLQNQISSQRTEIVNLNNEINDIAEKLAKKPWFNLGFDLSLKQTRTKPKMKVTNHIYPPMYSLPGLPIIEEDAPIPSHVFKPGEPVDLASVSAPHRIFQKVRETVQDVFKKKPDQTISEKPKGLGGLFRKNEPDTKSNF